MSKTSGAKGEEIDDQAQEKWERKLSALEVPRSVLQDISGEQLSRWSYKAQDARLDIQMLGFWERHRSAFFDVRVFHPNAESYIRTFRATTDLSSIHGNEKRRLYQPRPQGFSLKKWVGRPTHLREKLWGRGCVCTFGLHHNWRNGKEVLNLS